MPNSGSHLKLDFKNFFDNALGVGRGLSRPELAPLAARIAELTERIQERRGKDIGFLDLPYDEGLLREIRQRADELRSWCRNFVVLGIGGSALGNITVHTALNHPYHNMLAGDHASRSGAPRIFVLDNVDPDWLKALLEFLEEELPQTVFNVISKSGETAETMSQFLFFREVLRGRKGCDPRRQFVITTDPRPEKSLLRRIADKEGCAWLPIPPNVGGRFSVLSAVGLLSAAVSGVDVGKLLEGAAAMDQRCRSSELGQNPAAMYATASYLLYQKGKSIEVLMPYSHALRGLADWYCQLWAESLGKRDGLSKKDVFAGPTPIASVGVTDQHSVMQLYQDGPFDKVITFVEVENSASALPICAGKAEPELDYLAEHSFNELLKAELEATRCALRDKGRPNCTIKVPRVDAASLGELFMFFEYAVTYSGYLYDVYAFDQPGVELGKQYTYGLMGRAGFKPPRLD